MPGRCGNTQYNIINKDRFVFAGGAALSDRNSKFILIKTITAFVIITFLFGSPVIYKLWIDAVIHLGRELQMFSSVHRTEKL